MQNAWRKKSSGGADALAYGGVAAAVVFIFALTFGALDAPSGNRPANPTLIAQSSP